MWMMVLGFGTATLLLGWLLFGYVVWLRFVGDTRLRNDVPAPSELPFMSIIIPCLNEESMIVDKLDNVLASNYASDKLEIVVADGGSTDGTLALVEGIARQDPRVRIVRCARRGKINQLNEVLPTLRGDLVMVTDTDARINASGLTWVAAEFCADPDVAVVGGYTSPSGGLAVERCYWAAQNRFRLLESSVSHVSTVVACCYAFRRDLMDRFPDDVIADDVYITAMANTRGHKTVYCPRAVVKELRTPQSLPEFFRHKFRKSNAVLRELMRFAYALPDMDSRWKSILTTRIVQQLLLPWATGMWIALAVALVNMGQWDVPVLGASLLCIMLLVTRKATLSVELPGDSERFGPVTVVLAFAYTMAICCATALTYLSFRQTSCYARVGEDSKRDQQPSRMGSIVTKQASDVVPRMPTAGGFTVAVGESN